MEALTPWHLILILIGFMLLFGYKKLPDATRSLGRSLRIFKSEMRDLTDAPATAPNATRTDRAPAPVPPAAPSLADPEATATQTPAADLDVRATAHVEGPPSAV